LWDVGVWVPIVGASGKDNNRSPLGTMRTYAYVRGEFSLQEWIEAIRKGRTFVTTGPLVEFRANGHRPGDTLDAEGDVSLVAKVESLTPFKSLEIVENGIVIASAQGKFEQLLGGWSVTLQHTYVPDRSSWVIVRCIGMETFAHTSPIKLQVKDRPLNWQVAAAGALRQLVEQTREWGESLGRYSNAKPREQFVNRCALAIGRLSVQDSF
jgi:hypothetical protein